MQSKPKANSIVTSRIDTEAGSFDVLLSIPRKIIFEVEGQGDMTLDLSMVHSSHLIRALIHGWNQRIPDGAAIPTTDKDNNPIPRSERNRIKFERMNDLCRHYESGTENWNRIASGDGAGGRSLTIEAIARVQGVEYSEAQRRVEAYAERKTGGDTKKALAILRAGETVAKAMAEIRAERDSRKVAKSFDAEAELKELG